ncbi:amidohydrolase [Methyloprofundus sedimenti]|uniref:Amidohydrolase n=1 Tax=Methyloprofundus sedimenti TaxID=1420851 RepID=A0A1V8M1F7_9GAMM|nr:amidohydrolase family protein [Methyloprofundus sedimenti]OQK15362.1 amidohydrolase [Methyloprofundus sedimenti]
MKLKSLLSVTTPFMLAMCLNQGFSAIVYAHNGEDHGNTNTDIVQDAPDCQVLSADRLFDGDMLMENQAVLLNGNKVVSIGTASELSKLCGYRIELGDATILPGFIESHAHVAFQNVRKDKVLAHGITTVQDTGGALQVTEGGDGALRLLSTGPIIQAPGGYPLNIFGGGEGGYDQIGIPVSSVAQAEEVVANLVTGGATAIKIALESGGEPGAPWMLPHGDQPVPATPWNLLSQDIVNAIVTKAHTLEKRVIAHVGEDEGVTRALAAGVDEFAHMPCAAISDDLLHEAVQKGVTFVTTIDTLGSCVNADGMGIHSNTHTVAHAIEHNPDTGAQFIYGSEIGHDNVPWGINGEELHMMLHLTSGESVDFVDVLNVLKAATSEAGKRLDIPGLGTLSANAPADLIAVRGNPFQRFKLLEYPDLVISGGRTIINEFGYQSAVECLFAWAEINFPEYLAPAGAYTQVSNGFIQREYSSSQSFVHISNDKHRVYFTGADGVQHDLGDLSNWLATAGCH